MIKKFEEYRNEWGRAVKARNIDLAGFYHTYDQYHSIIEEELKGGEDIFVNIPSVMSVIREMLLGNKIEFFESVMREKTECTPKEINLNVRRVDDDFISIYCYEDKNTRTFTLRSQGPNFMKIWGDETQIEKIIRMAKEMNKYNL